MGVKIAFINKLPPGSEGSGSTHTFTQLATILDKRGHKVTAFYTSESSTPKSSGDINTRLISVPDGRRSFNKRFNEGIVDNSNIFDDFDIVHCYQMRGIPAMEKLAEQIDASTIVTLQAYAGVCPKNDLMFMNRRRCHGNGYLKCAVCAGATVLSDYSESRDPVTAMKWVAQRELDVSLIRSGLNNIDRIDAFHTYAEHMKNTYGAFGFPKENIHVIPNIFDDHFDVSHQSDFREPYKLLYAGRLSKEKGVEKFPEILKQLRDTGVEYTLTIAGKGESRDVIESMCEARGVADAVTFAGHVPYDEMPELYANHDIFVHPVSWEEPFARVYLEALGTGTPIVSTDVGVASDVFGSAGVVCEDSIDAFVTTIQSISELTKLSKMSTVGQRRVNQFTANDIVDSIEELYRKIGP